MLGKGIQKNFRVFRQRAIALFLFTIFVVSVLTPTASAIEAYRPDPANQNIIEKSKDKKKFGDPNKPMKQDFPEGEQAVETDIDAAADAKALGFRNKSENLAGEPLSGLDKANKINPRELRDRRTATSSVSVDKNGKLVEKQYLTPKHFKKDGKWELINTKLVEDKNAGDSGNLFGTTWGNIKSWYSEETTFTVKDNDWLARFASSDSKDGMLRIKKGNEQFGFSPVDAKKVDPVVSTAKDGRQIVRYYDLWPGVNVEYIVESAAVKENIIIKDRDATNQVSFDVLGAKLQKPKSEAKSAPAYIVKGVLDDEFAIAPPNLILNNFGFVTDETVFRQDYKDDRITLSVDSGYLEELPDKAFPAVLDPTTFDSRFGTRAGGNYMSFKSDGYVCYSNICNPYAGTLFDSGGTLRAWRGAIHAPYSEFQNSSRILTDAKLHLTQRSNESFWTGDWDTHTFYAGHAYCLNSFNCVNTAAMRGSATFSSVGDINLTTFYQERIAAGDFGAWVMIVGDEHSTHSFKNFDPDNSYVQFTYGGPPPAPGIVSPTQNQVYVDPQASFSVGYVANSNGSTPLQYEFLVSTGSGATGGLIPSGNLHSLQWTVPDGILEDGSTYYIQARSFDPITGTYSGWGSSVPFRIDMRTGKDSTQTYDTLGPVNVNLATGNLSTGSATHTSSALGGSLGVSLNYNSPLKSRAGLVGQYWSNDSFSGSPVVTRIDKSIDFNWDSGSPSSGLVPNDNFSVRWQGYFTAPETGTYQFGSDVDDGCRIWVNEQLILDNWTWCGAQYGAGVSLSAGQTIPIKMDYREVSGGAVARLKVKGVVSSSGITVPNEWLQTGVRPVADRQGLTGRYYARNDGTNTFSSGNPMVMQRTDQSLNFQWMGAPVASGPMDFLVRWTGYVTVPESGTYQFGTLSDDGSRIKLGADNTVVYDDWVAHSPTEGYGTNVTLTANVPTKITIEYFDSGGSATFQFKVKAPGATSPQLVPTGWLSPSASIVPNGWDIGLDADGSLGYDYLDINQNSAVLIDSTGGTHEYSWTGSGYKPPVNEDGQLVRNVDGTFTLQDVDGRTYVFGQDGSLTSATNPMDDRNPAALQYEYQYIDDEPARLHRIKDGVDSSRTATLFYSGATECGTAPAGFDGDAPTGMVCAVVTDDARSTYFYYVQGQLARIAKPGNELVDYRYEEVRNPSGAIIGYRIESIRDVVANDAVAAGVRANDDTVKTQLEYDELGRVITVTQPAPSANSSRLQHTIEYLPGKKAYVDENGSSIPGYFGMTKQHVTGASEPHGFSKRVKFDNLFRTTEVTDNANLSNKTEWDPLKDLVLSTTDAVGLKSTSIYDDEDRLTDSYGPAPSAWYDANRLPQTSPTDYSAQIPHNRSNYDEGITGSAVSWYDYSRPTGNSSGKLFGAPKLHTTGIDSGSPGVMSADLVNGAPITAGSGMEGIGFSATGKLRLPNGTYWINADTSEGIRVWVDDILVIDKWEDAAYRSITGGSFTVTDHAVKRLRVDSYRKTGSLGAFNVWLKQDNGFDWTNNWSSYLKPGYSLKTSTESFDSTIGNTKVSTNYGLNPELSIAEDIAVDPSGLNLTTSKTHEQPGATDSLLRQTSKTLPGGGTSSYAYYTGTETRDNPCTTVVENDSQAGFLKLKTEADPDGAGPLVGRATETVFDGAGRAVASRLNQDDWTCTSYDTRGRVAQIVNPAIGSESSRTITHNYAVGGDPLVTSVEDSGGPVVTQIDLLGRAIFYRDAQWNETWTQYDSIGLVTSKTSPLGVETFVYDNYHRLIQQKLDDITYAVVSYDSYGRMHKVDYPNANGQQMILNRDSLGRMNGKTYYQGGAQNSGVNLIQNNSAEQVSGSNPDTPDGWSTNAWGTNAASFTYLNEGYTGNRSVKTEITEYTDGDAKWQFSKVPVSASTTYTFKDYYRSNVVSEAVVEYTHQDQSVTYQWVGNINASTDWVQSNLSFTTPATATHATVYHLISSAGWLIVDDVEIYESYQSDAAAVMASESVVLSQSGQVISSNVSSGTQQLSTSYGYDKAGRLTSANIGQNSYTYSFGDQDASCGTAGNMNLNSGKNSNRTSQTINGVTTSYCYDYADRLISSSDPLSDAVEYDSHGNITKLGSGSTPLYLGYDSSDRNTGYSQYDGNGNGKGVYYSRDVQGRINFRETDTILNWTWTPTNEWWYGFTDSSDAPDFVRNASWDIVEKYLTLPGGVNLTIKPQQTGNAQKQYSLPNLHGDVLLTTDASGVNTSISVGPANTFAYDPFGNALFGSLYPANFESGSHGWLGQHQKVTETSLALTPIQMGARVYLPTLGRFAQVDSIEGGNENAYVYPPNPIGRFDLDGTRSWSAIGGSVIKAIADNGDKIKLGAGMVQVGVCIAVVAACGAALLTGIVISSVVTASQSIYEGNGLIRTAGLVGSGVVVDAGMSRIVNVAKIAKRFTDTNKRGAAVVGSSALNQVVQTTTERVYQAAVLHSPSYPSGARNASQSSGRGQLYGNSVFSGLLQGTGYNFGLRIRF